MSARISLLRFCGVLFFFISLIPEAYCIKVRGLNIEKIEIPHTTWDSESNPTGDNLDKLLANYPFEDTVIDPEVDISFPAEADDNSAQGNSSASTNTDLESIDSKTEDDQTASVKRSLAFALNTTPDNKESKWNYLKEAEITGSTAQVPWHRALSSQLAKDACKIANAHEHRRTRESTTCLCVTLRDQKQYAKKFVFHNGSDKMKDSMVDVAHTLGYGVRTGYQAHAEAEFIEFLLHRSKQNSDRYTHILGMGCSRQHCGECDCLFKLYLGQHYHEFTAAMKKEGAAASSVKIPAIESLGEGEGDGVRMTIPAELQVFKVVHTQEAVENKIYDKYRLSKAMQSAIKRKIGYPDLTFPENRFSIQEAVIKRTEKKRRLDNTKSAAGK